MGLVCRFDVVVAALSSSFVVVSRPSSSLSFVLVLCHLHPSASLSFIIVVVIFHHPPL
jgi:hypothetical protein